MYDLTKFDVFFIYCLILYSSKIAQEGQLVRNEKHTPTASPERWDAFPWHLRERDRII
jgi:hypothetical protein